MALGRHDGKVTELSRQWACVVAFVGAVHDQRGRLCNRPKLDQQRASCRRIVILAGGESEGDGAAITRGNPMKFGGPATAGFADGLGTVFVKAPVPSGCPLLIVLSRETASILILRIGRAGITAKTGSRTPRLAQRIMRV